MSAARDLSLVAALGHLAETDWGATSPALVATWPWSSGNPYQRLMTSRFPAHGLTAVPCAHAGTAAGLAREVGGDLPVVAHLHWLAPVLSSAQDDVDAERLVDAAVDDLDRLGDLGVPLVWTVHNVLPHDARHEAAQARLHQAVADRAALVHVMTDGTPAACSPWYSLDPARTIVVPHPSYAGAIGPPQPREAARRTLGLPRDAHVLLALGRVSPYKGVEEVADAFERTDGSGSMLVVAGVVDDRLRDRLDALARRRDVLVLPGYADDDRVAALLGAADAVVLPYRRSLNSGVLALAATAGVPVVLPRGAGEGWADDRWTVAYDADDPDGLADALRRSRDLGDAARAAALAAAAAHDPVVLSDRLATAVAGIVGAAP